MSEKSAAPAAPTAPGAKGSTESEARPEKEKPPGGQLIKSGELRVRVSLSAPVAVARRMINRGQVITADDVQLSKRQIGLTSPRLLKLEAVIGQQAKRAIRPDQVIGTDDLSPLALVKRNRLVTVWLRRGGLLIKTVGRALQDGIYGERIIIRNEQTRLPFYAVVTGVNTVELDPTPLQRTGTERKPPATVESNQKSEPRKGA